VRYVEWTPEDSDSRRRGRLVVESERNVDFASRQADADTDTDTDTDIDVLSLERRTEP
tara:strand:- start:392 stop:565 length:174 start_codon:yes stop_codon:yes gene_type:complete